MDNTFKPTKLRKGTPANVKKQHKSGHTRPIKRGPHDPVEKPDGTIQFRNFIIMKKKQLKPIIFVKCTPDRKSVALAVANADPTVEEIITSDNEAEAENEGENADEGHDDGNSGNVSDESEQLLPPDSPELNDRDVGLTYYPSSDPCAQDSDEIISTQNVAKRKYTSKKLSQSVDNIISTINEEADNIVKMDVDDIDQDLSKSLSSVVNALQGFKERCKEKVTQVNVIRKERKKAFDMIATRAQKIRKISKCCIDECANTNVSITMHILPECTHQMCSDCMVKQMIKTRIIVIECPVCKK